MSASADGNADDIDENWLLSWSDSIEEETADEISPSLLFNSDSSFWSGEFLPPPPRPPYLEDQIAADGLTTCDLCTWALEQYSEAEADSVGVDFGISNHITFTLILVSLLSALLGAIVMIVVIHCRGRISSEHSPRYFFSLGRRRVNNLAVNTRGNDINLESNIKNLRGDENHEEKPRKSRQSWLLLNRPRRAVPMQLTSTISSAPASNHYTVEDAAYTSINDAVYTELDRIPTPAYQNSAYVLESDNDRASSAPSSAYYSDISMQDRAYETVGHTSHWDTSNEHPRRPTNQRLCSIRENSALHSNYI